MRVSIAIVALTLAGLVGFAAEANAGDSPFSRVVHRKNHHLKNFKKVIRHRTRRHKCVRSPIYTKIWVAPVYHTKVVGYQECGRPIYRKVCVRAGFYRRVIKGYRCSRCGAH